MNRNTYQVVSFNGKEYQLDYVLSAYVRLHLQALTMTGYTVEQSRAYRPDLIAVDAYGLPDNWWVICLVNGIVNPQRELFAGRFLNIPNQQDVEEVLQNMLSATRFASRVGNKVSL